MRRAIVRKCRFQRPKLGLRGQSLPPCGIIMRIVVDKNQQYWYYCEICDRPSSTKEGQSVPPSA